MKPTTATTVGRDDGRHIDPALGILSGEGATIRMVAPEHAYPAPRETAECEGKTYYGQPVLKAPVWIWSVPAYFFVGGTAGAASALAAAAQAFDPRGSRRLIRRAHQISMAGDILSAGLLIHDLGRPTRFLNMLRVFRPTSPMSVGSWVLAMSGAASTLAVLAGERRGAIGHVGKAAGYVSGGLGLPLAGYTGVLLTSTAVPIWQGGRRALPPLFLASSAAGAGALLSMLPIGARGRAAARRFGMFGDVAALALGLAYEREVSRVRRVASPLRHGPSGVLWALSRALTGASVVLSAASRTDTRRRAAGALTLLGAASLRAAVFLAGKASARDPQATFEQQRAGLGAAEVTASRGAIGATPSMQPSNLRT
ncbi:Formate dehydrogenase O putative subunit protein [Minicystis rosea]|nr:Formate dehydrogenase O putative subunit protein [Minicystis rosea]